MRRLAALVTPLLAVVAFALHRGDFVSGSQALLLAAGVEVLLFARMFLRVGSFTRAYRQSRGAGGNGGTRFREALAASNSGPFAKIFLGELLVWHSLWRFVRGGWKRREGDFSYHRRSPLIGLVLVTVITAPAELLVIELVVPWRMVKLILLLLALYSLLWILGYAASQIGSPHRVTSDGVQIRKGFLASTTIPLHAIAHIDTTREALPPGAEGWGATIIDSTAYFAVAGRADVDLSLNAPVVVRHLIGNSEPLMRVRVAVDEPSSFARAIAARIGPAIVASPSAITPQEAV